MVLVFLPSRVVALVRLDLCDPQALCLWDREQRNLQGSSENCIF